MLTNTTQARRTKGFTLTEAAIVLGIVGLILGAIWVAAAAVYENMKAKRANEEIMAIAQAVRSMYASSNATGLANATDMTDALRIAGVFPQDMVQGNLVNNPWNIGVTAASTVAVHSAQGTAVGDAFTIYFGTLPGSACSKVLMSNGGQGAEGAGVLGITGAADIATAAPLLDALAGTPVPTDAVTVTGLCNRAGTANAAGLKFRLKN